MGAGMCALFLFFKALVYSFFFFEIEQNREKVRARRSGSVTALANKKYGVSKMGVGAKWFSFYLGICEAMPNI